MKNAVFWLAETYPDAMFQSEMLICLILKALSWLKQALTLNFILYNMIPERNLFKEKISEIERKSLYETFSVLIRMGPATMLRCKKICDIIHMTPQDLAIFRKKAHDLELLYLLLVVRMAILDKSNTSPEDMKRDTEIRQLGMSMDCSVESGWPPHFQEKKYNYLST